ncbi:MAG: DUF1003 domain-containing protein [Caldilineaceae bacterium]|nr:DUF1003 domain-containing protein [Caldilineaceae bacterium]
MSQPESSITHPLAALKALHSQTKPLRNVNSEHAQSLGATERLALFITERVGTMGFFLLIFTWTVLWLGWNLLAPTTLQFDPPTAFVFWLFISNLIQILLMPLIMVGQNLQGRHAELRAENDYEVNRKAEQEIELLLQHLEEQTALLKTITQRLEMPTKLEAD